MSGFQVASYRIFKIPGVVLAALLLCAGPHPVAGAVVSAPRERDVWYVFIAGDQRWGTEHVQVRRQADGTYCYEIETRLLLDLLGQRQELTDKAKYVVTADYQFVSLEEQSKTLGATSHVQGKVSEGKLVLSRQSEGGRTSATLDLQQRPLLRACLDDWLAGLPAETAKVTIHVLNCSALAIRAGTASRLKGAVDQWDVEIGPELSEGRLSLDAQGVRREWVFRLAPGRIERSTADEARRIRHRTVEGRELLMFPVGKPIAAAERLNWLTVRLAWRDIPFDRFRLEDERQKVVRRGEKEGRYEAVVRIVQAMPPGGDVRHPITGAEFPRYLSTTDFIKPEHPEIVRQAREWIGREKTALRAVRALSAAVFKHMQGGTMIAETLSGPDVLRSRKGKCSEYAVLFASLARSAGIPTRIVLGMRLVSGSWVGHMWNESYVGRWITVDATADEVGGSPALLKLIDSETVMGTFALRWDLTRSLEVAVEEFDPPPAAVASGMKTGIVGSVYTNAEAGCRMTAPDPGWTLHEGKKSGVAKVIRFKVPGRDDVNIHLVTLSVPPVYTPSMLLGLRNTRFKTMYKEYEVLEDRDYRFSNRTGRLLVFRHAGKEGSGKRMKTTEVMWGDGTSCYLLNLIAEEKSHDEYLAAFYRLLNSYETLAKSPEKPPQAKAGPAPKDGQPKASELKTGIAGAVYTNVERGCRITAPDKTWALEEVKRAGLGTTIRFKIPGRDDVKMHFVTMAMPTLVTPEMFLRLRSAGFKNLYQGYEVLEERDYRFNGRAGRILVFCRAGKDGSSGRIKTTEVMWSDGGNCYLLNLAANEKSHDEFQAAFFKLAGSFQALPRPAEKPLASTKVAQESRRWDTIGRGEKGGRVSFKDEPAAHALYKQMIASMRKANSLSYTSQYLMEGKSYKVGCTYHVWLKKPNYFRVETESEQGKGGVLVGDGKNLWIYWPLGRPMGFIDEKSLADMKTRFSSYMTKPAGPGRHSIGHETGMLGAGLGMPIIDPSTFHGYTDSLQPYLDGVKALPPEKVGTEECEGIEVSIMKHQRSWYLWLSKADHLPRKLKQVVRVSYDLVMTEDWSKVTINGDIPDKLFAWKPKADWTEWRYPSIESGLLKPGTAAPDFHLASADGNRIKLSGYRGKAVWFYVWRAG